VCIISISRVQDGWSHRLRRPVSDTIVSYSDCCRRLVKERENRHGREKEIFFETSERTGGEKREFKRNYNNKKTRETNRFDCCSARTTTLLRPSRPGSSTYRRNIDSNKCIPRRYSGTRRTDKILKIC